MPKFTVTFASDSGDFDLDYRGASENAVRSAAASDFPDFTVASVVKGA